jgi:hypothetical protein
LGGGLDECTLRTFESLNSIVASINKSYNNLQTLTFYLILQFMHIAKSGK